MTKTLFLLLLLPISFFSFGQNFVDSTPSIGTKTWTVPSGVTNVTLEIWGAGGAGGGSATNKTGGSGGGGGGYATKIISVTPGQPITYFVGSGGSGSKTAGANGRNTTMTYQSSTSLTANGGEGGKVAVSNSSISGGIGGDANGGSTNTTGSNGSGVLNQNNVPGGKGGSGANGGTGGSGADGNDGGNGGNGSSPGGGGGGGVEKGNSFGNGGKGGNGQVKISYTCPTYSLTSVTATNTCKRDNTSTVKLNSTTSNLPAGNYTITYRLSYDSYTVIYMANMVVTTPGTGDFTADISALRPTETTNIRIDNIASSTCSTSITTNNTSNVLKVFAITSKPTITNIYATCNNYIIQWHNDSVDEYFLDVATDSNFTTFLPGYENRSFTGDVQAQEILGMASGATYYCRVRSRNYCGTSVNSDTRSFVKLGWSSINSIEGGDATIPMCSKTNPFTNSTWGGGVWSIVNGTGSASIESSGIVTGLSPGTVTVVFTANGSCPSSTIKSLIVTGSSTNSIALSSAPGTDSQSLCIKTAITPITYSTIGATDATVTGLPNGVTGSWASNVVTISGTPTESKLVPFNYKITLIGGCGTISTTGTITVKPLLTAPTIGLITLPTCTTLTGSVVLSGLPASGNLLRLNTDGITINKNFSIISGTSITITELPPGTYKFAVDDCTPVYSEEVIIEPKTNIWNGSKWSNENKPPTLDDIVDFQSDYEMTSDLNFCSVTVSKGVKVTVKEGKTMTVLNGVHVDLDPSTSLTFENNASLMQTNVASDINTGIIEYNRTAGKILRGDFVYWSTPVSPQTLFNLSPLTSGDKYMWYNGNNANWVIAKGSDPMMPGKGYIVRGPQNYSNNENERKDYPATFKGTPNNGDIPGETVKADKYYLIGNPYPSALKAKEFLDDNPFLLGTLYFWTHNTKVSLQGAYEYSSDDYATYNLTGSTTAAPSGSITGNNKDKPSGYIAAGQSFFARIKPASDPVFDDPSAKVIAFNNRMRIGGDNNGLFFKPGKTSKETDTDRNRIWLNLTNTKGAFKQTLVGYVEGATNDFDDRYDGISFDGNAYIDFYSVNNQRKFTIQGRALPFANTDLVPLGYRTTIAGDFTISIDEGDGVFTQQAIYLEDKKTGTVNDLRAANYTFTTTAGTFTDRFVLRYTNKTLGTADFENLENTILVSVKDKVIKATSTKEAIKEVIIFDVSGKLLYNKNKVNATELQISNLLSNNQVLLVKVTLDNGYSTTKKIIFR